MRLSTNFRIFLILILIQTTFISSVEARFPQSNSAEKSASKSNDQTQQQKKESTTTTEKTSAVDPKARALDQLKSALSNSVLVSEPIDRADVVGAGAILLWKYDQQSSRSHFSNIFDSLFDSYERAPDAKAKGKIEDAIKKAAKTLASKDPSLSLKMLSRFTELKDKNSDKKTPKAETLSDKLMVAEEAIAEDPKLSAQIATEMLNDGIPSTFPIYLYDLAKQDQSLADGLFRTAVGMLGNRQGYDLTGAILLSGYAFKESDVAVPSLNPNAPDPNTAAFGIHFYHLSNDPPALDPAIGNEYLIAMQGYITSLPFLSNVGPKADRITIARLLFLTQKLYIYATYYNAAAVAAWSDLISRAKLLAESQGVDLGKLSDQSKFIDRLTKGKPLIDFGDGTSDFEAAGRSQTAEERDKHLISGIMNLTDKHKFDEAEAKLLQISDKTAHDRLADYVDFRAGEAAFAGSDWNEFSHRASHIQNVEQRVFLLLEGASSGIKEGKKKKAFFADYLNEAVSLTEKMLKGGVKADFLIASADLLYKIDDVAMGNSVMVEAIHALNEFPKFASRGPSLFLNLGGTYAVAFVIKDATLDDFFRDAAKIDWESTILLTQNLDSHKTRLLGQISACKAYL